MRQFHRAFGVHFDRGDDRDPTNFFGLQ
jgi:hypothetical protein